MKSPFEISEYGNLLMYKSGYTAETVRNLIDSHKLNGLRIFDHWEPVESLDFLRDFSFLKHLEVAVRYDQDYSFLRNMTQLEHLSIGPSFPMENPIDLSHQVNLTYLSLQWRKNRISGLEACQKLEDLCLVEFREQDLKLLSKLTRINRLRIKTGSIISLDGIEGLNKLREVEIGNCRHLRSICHLNGRVELAALRIESCRKIEDYGSLSNLPNLKIMQLINCGQLPSFSYPKIFPKLTDFRLLGNTKFSE